MTTKTVTARHRTTSELLELVDKIDSIASHSNGRAYGEVRSQLRAAYEQASGERDPGEGTPDDIYRTLNQSDVLKAILDAYFGGLV